MYTEKIKVYLKRAVGFFKYSWSREDAHYYSGEVGSHSCDAVVVIAAHGRMEILLNVVNHLLSYRDTNSGLSVSVVVCVSSLKDAERLNASVGEKRALHIIRCANRPLGNKWQQAIYYAKSLNPKALVVCGSDDLVSYSYLSKCLSHISDNDAWSLCGTDNWHMVDQDSQVFSVRYKKSSSARVLGSGRVYSRKFLDQVDWQLFDLYLNSGLDYKGLSKAFKRKGYKLHIIEMEFTVMSVKGAWSMLNSLDDIRMSDRLDTEILTAQVADRSIREFGLQ